MGRIARRGPMAIPIVDKERNETFQHLTPGSTVEVSSDEEGFKGAWYEAKILQSNSRLNRKGKYLIQYQTLVTENDSSELLTETVDVSFIRPVPPPPAANQTYEPDDVVDAFHRDGWWKGVVSKVDLLKRNRKLITRYTVNFEDPPEAFDFYSKDLRFHLVWIHGRWVRHPKQKEIPNRTQCEEEKGGEEGEEEVEEEVEVEVELAEEEVVVEQEQEIVEEEQGQEIVEEEEEEQSVHVSFDGSSTVDNHGEEKSSVKKSRKNPFEQSTPFSSTSTSKKQKMSAPETETVPKCSDMFRKENSANTLSPDESHPASMLMKSTEQITDSAITKCSMFDTLGNLQMAGSNSLNQGKNSVLPNRTQCEERSAHVPRNDSSTANNDGKEKSSAEMSKKNPLQQSTPLRSTSTTTKLNMPTPEEKLPNHSNKFRKDNSENPLFPDGCHATLMLMNSIEQATDSTITKCSPCDTSGNLQLAGSISLNKGKNFDPNQQEAGVENGMTESSKNREIELNAQVKGQQVPPAGKHGCLVEAWKNLNFAAGEEKTNEDSAEVINEGHVEHINKSSAVNVQAETELDLPFRKSSYLWKQFDSQEVFRVLPQRPHFSPLLDCNEETREGTAIGHMLTFASLVEKVSKLQIETPRSLFDSYLEALDILEMLGFDVKAVADRVKELLFLKTKKEEVDNRSKKFLCKMAESDDKKAKLEQEISEIDKKMRELEEQRAATVSEKVKEDITSDFLQLNLSRLKDYMLNLEHKFKVKAAAPW